MNLILRQVIGYQQGLKKASTSASPLLKKQLENTQKDLNSILTKWKFGDTPLTSAEEFLNNFEPWINDQLTQQKNLKLFLAKKGVNNLAEAETKLTNRDLSAGEELTQLREELVRQEQTFLNTEQDYLSRIEELQKSQETSEAAETIKQEFAQEKELWKHTEEDYLTRIADQDRELKDKVKEFQTSNGELLKRIEELESKETAELSETDQEKLAQYDNLKNEIQNLKSQLETYQKGEDWESKTGEIITSLEQEIQSITEVLNKTENEIKDFETERDELTRDKKELEQEVLAQNNQLKNKQQEINNKEKSLELLKKEKSQTEIALNKTITELRAEQKKLQVKYSKQGKLLDEEQTDNNKLTEKITQLETQIQQLKGGKT